MKRKLRQSLSLLLALVVALGGAGSFIAGAVVNKEEAWPAIVIPGVFQSDVRYYDDDGNEMLKADGSKYEAPFFLEDTRDIVKDALRRAVFPLARLLISQYDKDQACAKGVAQVLGTSLAGNVMSDNQGRFIKNIRAIKYETNLANLSEYDRNRALDQIPLNQFVQEVGLDYLYFFSYESLGNIYTIARELYDLIQTAKEETGRPKVNLVPISQGGSIFNALMQIYRDEGRELSEDVHRVVFIIPAADGTAILGDIYHYGLLDDNDALYGYMFPSLIGEDEYLSYLVNIILRAMPNADVNNIIDTAAHILVEDYLEYSTCLWALIPSKDYPECREIYLSDPEDAFIREQTDWYYNAQVHSREYILEEQARGIEFFDIVDYNEPLYAICDSWNKVNGDGVIHVDSTSFGAFSNGVDPPLGEGYVQQNTYCSDPENHNHIDPAGVIDASTGILCETTFYFYGQNHESTARNDVVIRLATRILIDDSFENVWSDPGYPQFNYARHSGRMESLLRQWRGYDPSGLPDDQRVEFEEALAEAEAAYASTCMPTEEYQAAYDRLNLIGTVIRTGKAPVSDSHTAFQKFLTKVLKWYADLLYRLFGGRGFSDVLLGRK
ncbi:MAG: hypothetical protein IJJ85_05325 [Clostridia bacterium]|nr:hypothetical protein [Clostridia bacterium]